MIRRLRPLLPELVPLMALLLLPLLFFWPQTPGGRTLLPAENLYQYEPYASYRAEAGAPALPHNHLLSDLVLQNMQWKSFIRAQLAAGEMPLWNPHQFAGIPFFAAGQHSMLYPPAALYYLLPLDAAYGWFTVLNLWLAGAFMYLFMRAGLGAGRPGALLAGVVCQLGGFMLASVVFPMIIGAAVWLPLLLLTAELIVGGRPFLGRQTALPWVGLGAAALGCNILAGHPEMTIYTLLIVAYYAGGRLLWELWAAYRGGARGGGLLRRPLLCGMWLVVMVGLGFGLAAVQFLPLLEFVGSNWRSERGELATVLGYAHPPRDLIQFLLPNFYGSPAQHSYFDWFSMQTVTDFTDAAGRRITYIDWGIKNYVEGALYVGVLPLLLAAYALADALLRRRQGPPYRRLFALLAGAGLSFMFGLPTYALIYALPGINQLNSPFRWVFAVTAAVAVLSGLGLEALRRDGGPRARWLGRGAMAAGAALLALLLASRLLYEQIEPALERVFRGMALAEGAFSDARMFYSFQFSGLLWLGLVLLVGGLGLLWLRAGVERDTALSLRQDGGGGLDRWARRRRAGLALVLLVTAADLMAASNGFNPASDPALLDYMPPPLAWMQEHAHEGRFITLEDPARHRALLQANMTLRYGLDDVRGYDSIVSAQYMDYMRALAPQVQADFNRVAPLYVDYAAMGQPAVTEEVLASPLLHLLNVRYVVSYHSTDITVPGYRLAAEVGPLRFWENTAAVPRAYTVPQTAWREEWLPGDDGRFDYALLAVPQPHTAALITADSGREKLIELETDAAVWLVVSESYAAGWRAFIRPQGADEAAEQALPVQLVLGNFQGVRLDEAGAWTLRLVYSPASFQIGLFATLISVALLALLAGIWFWRAYVGVNTESSSQAARVARNSLAPIILNLFNRGIDFAFAIVMLRILSPEEVGVYYYAVVIFVWFDIFTNFGLDLFLMREVSRRREASGHYFYNTTLLRLLLSGAGVPLLVAFLTLRQLTIEPAFSTEGLIALGLLYVGLFPASLSKGMTSLFYAYERAEVPAAIATITTINKTIFGVLALVLGYGIIGLAAVSIINNLITFVVLVYSGRGLIGRIIQRRPDGGLMRAMVGESWPLMLNHFLATIFFQIDIVILEALKGSRIVGLYSVAYRWILAINIVPAFFTQALLPLMSRQAHSDRAALRRTYTLGVKLLFALALPLAVAFTLLAEPLTYILGGSQYLPDGAIALLLMIWSIPAGWINSLTQYVLVALDLQRMITRAFFVAVLFNISVNLLFIPQYGYPAAAVATIFSEIVLLVPFVWMTQRALGRLEWGQMLWRPAAAAVAMVLAALLLRALLGGEGAALLLATLAGGLVYGVVLLALRPLSEQELALLPGRLQFLGRGLRGPGPQEV